MILEVKFAYIVFFIIIYLFVYDATSRHVPKNRYAMRTCICEAKRERDKSYINVMH